MYGKEKKNERKRYHLNALIYKNRLDDI